MVEATGRDFKSMECNVIDMELAVSTLFCLDKPFHDALADILLSGSRCVELIDDGLHSLDRLRVERLLELKASYGIRYALHAPFSDMNLAAWDDALREVILRRMEASIRWASSLEVEAFVIHPGWMTALEHFIPGSAWRRNLESMRRLIRYAYEYGVPALFENVPEPYPFLLKSLGDFERLCGEVDFDLRLTLDVAHSHLRDETLGFIERLSYRIGHVHVSDNMGVRDDHLQLGLGTINWEEIMEALRGIDYRGWVVVESLEGVGESLEFLRSLLAHR